MGTKQKLKPPVTQEGQEAELISLAMKQAREQLLQGVAPASTVNLCLKLALENKEIEKEQKRAQLELTQAKAQNLKDAKGETEAYLEAVEAMKSYGRKQQPN